jgi:hypothetical protein
MVYMKQKLSDPLSLRIEKKVRKAHRLIDNPLHDRPKKLITVFEDAYKFVEGGSAVGNLKFGVICSNIYVFMKKKLERTGKIRTRSYMKRRIDHLVDCSNLETYIEKKQAKWFFSKVIEQTARLLEKKTDFSSFEFEILHHFHTIERHPKAKAGLNGLQVAMILSSVEKHFMDRIKMNY